MAKSKHKYKHKKRTYSKRPIKQSLAERIVIGVIMVSMIGGSCVASIMMAINPPSQYTTQAMNEEILRQMGLTDEQIANMSGQDVLGDSAVENDYAIHDNLFEEETEAIPDMSSLNVGDKVVAPIDAQVGDVVVSVQEDLTIEGGSEYD